MKVLVSLHRGYGLGDAAQMSAVLRHVVKYRPDWEIDFQAEAGRHTVGYGIVKNTFEFGQLHPSEHYDCEVEICLYDTWSNWQDRPNTRVSSCLHERFGLEWDAECGRYEINIPRDVWYEAQVAFGKITATRPKLDTKMVAVHYKGDSSPANKDLSDSQVDKVVDHILALGRAPLLIDWRNVSPLARRRYVCSTGLYPQARDWGRSADKNCAMISLCEAFVGIDSGPGKCASATNIPSLITWTGHHPAPFHDPASNTTHLVPRGYHGLFPVCNDSGVIKWFEANHRIRQYESDPVEEIKNWLTETLVS